MEEGILKFCSTNFFHWPQQLLGGVHCTIRNESANHSYSHIVFFKKKPNKLKKTQYGVSQIQESAPKTGSSDSFRPFSYRLFTTDSYSTKMKQGGKKGKWGTFMSNQAQGLIFCKSLCKIAPMQQMLEIGKWCSARTFSNRREKGTWAQIGRRRKHQMWNRTYPKGKEGRRLENVSIGLI